MRQIVALLVRRAVLYRRTKRQATEAPLPRLSSSCQALIVEKEQRAERIVKRIRIPDCCEEPAKFELFRGFLRKMY